MCLLVDIDTDVKIEEETEKDSRKTAGSEKRRTGRSRRGEKAERLGSWLFVFLLIAVILLL